MATATKEKTDDQIVKEEPVVTEDDLAKAKAELEAKDGVEDENPDEPSKVDDNDDAKQDDSTEEDEKPQDQDEPTFTKKFPNLKGDDWENYAKELETAYDNSFKEVRRLKELKTEAAPADDGSTDPALAYARGLMQEDAQKAFDTLAEKYPQVQDLDKFEVFRKTVEGVSATLNTVLGRQPTFQEAYDKSASLLGWEAQTTDDAAERVGNAVKNSAATTKTNSATKQAKPSKITDAMMIANRKMYPNKTDQQIREELEEYVK